MKLQETCNYTYSITLRQQFEIPGPSLRVRGRSLYIQYSLNTELELRVLLCKGNICVRESVIGAKAGGHGVLGDSLTILQLFFATGQHSAW